MINIRSILGLDYYTSEIDQFLKNFDKTHPNLSASQRKEKEKFTRIYQLRDDPKAHEINDDFWDNF